MNPQKQTAEWLEREQEAGRRFLYGFVLQPKEAAEEFQVRD